MANEQRLIDAVRYREVLERYANAPHVNILYSTHSKVMRMAIDTCIEFLDMQKTVDAVEVVRCKDCKHYHPRCQSVHWEGKKNMCCRSANVHTKPDDFCSYGERKDNGKID